MLLQSQLALERHVFQVELRLHGGPAEPGGELETIVAAEAGVILGFATAAPAREPEMSGSGELCALYVDPDRWNRGIGVALVAAARSRLCDLGFRQEVLDMLIRQY